MANIQIYGKLKANNPSAYGIVDSEEVVGGFMSLTTSERTSLPLAIQKAGMLVYDVTIGQFYRLSQTGATPHWVQALYTKEEMDAALAAKSSIAIEFSILPEEWDLTTNPISCVKAGLTGVTANNNIIVSTSDADVECVGQGYGTLTFEASTIPEEVSVKVVVLP